MLSCTPLGARTRNRQHAPRAGRDLEADFQLYQGRVVEGADGLRALIVATRGRRVHIHNVGTARAAWWDVIERACKVEKGEGGGSTSTKHRARTTHMSMPAWHARSVPATLLPTPPLSFRAHETPTLRICRSGMPPTARHTTSLTHAYFEKSWSRCKAPSQVLSAGVPAFLKLIDASSRALNLLDSCSWAFGCGRLLLKSSIPGMCDRMSMLTCGTLSGTGSMFANKAERTWCAGNAHIRVESPLFVCPLFLCPFEADRHSQTVKKVLSLLHTHKHTHANTQRV